MSEQERAEELFIQGRNFFLEENYQKALSCLEQVRGIIPQQPVTYVFLSQTYLSLERYQEAIDTALIYLEWAAENDEAEQEALLTVLSAAGWASHELGDNDIALKYFALISEFKPNSINSLVGQGMAYWGKNEYDQALEKFRQCLIIEPNNSVANYWIARIHAAQGQWHEAIETFKFAIELDGSDPNAYLHLALNYLAIDDTWKAYEQVHALEELNAQSHIEKLRNGFAVRAGMLFEDIVAGEPVPEIASSVAKIVAMNSATEEPSPVVPANNQVQAMEQSENLSALATLSLQWNEQASNRKVAQSALGDKSTLISYDTPLRDEGEKILCLIEEEYRLHPRNIHAQFLLGAHLSMLGDFYFDSLSSNYLKWDWDKYFDELWEANDAQNISQDTLGLFQMMFRAAPENAKCASSHYHRALELFDVIPPAMINPVVRLSDIFAMAGFYGTAIHWLELALEIAMREKDNERTDRLKASIMRLKMNGKTSDPPLSGVQNNFPDKDTKGLQLSPAQREAQAQTEREAKEKQQREVAERESQRQQQLQEEEHKLHMREEHAKQNERRQAGQCLHCGVALGFMDKLKGKLTHGHCERNF